MRPEEIPDSLAATRPLVQAFRGACRGADLAPAEAALRYVARRYAISQIVFGVEDHDQLWFDLRVAMRAARLPSAIDWAPFEAIASVADALGSVVHPSRWARPEVPA
jgi:hypothetical protein